MGADRTREIEARVNDVMACQLCGGCGYHEMLRDDTDYESLTKYACQCYDARRIAEDATWLLARVRELEAALRAADAEASVAHDAIWSETVAGCGRLHDNDDPLSAQSAIWRLHDVARAVLSDASPANEEDER